MLEVNEGRTKQQRRKSAAGADQHGKGEQGENTAFR
jgi:hypothetical protein